MSPAPTSNISNPKPVEGKNLSIEIEPAYPLIVAITGFFRAQKMPQKALEICRMGLDYFPGDLGLRLELAMSYLDLSEKGKAWNEIMTVVEELSHLAPVFESIADHFRQKGPKELGEWFHQLSLALSKPPAQNPGTEGDPPVLSLFPEEEFQTEGNPPAPENSPQEGLEPPNYSQTVHKDISLSFPGKISDEKEKPREGLPDPGILSTLTGWLTQLKESKA